MYWKILEGSHAVDWDSPYLNIYTNHKIVVNRVPTSKNLLVGCVFALLAFLHISNGMSLMSTLYSYSLQPVLIKVVVSTNKSDYIVKFQYLLTHLYSKLNECLWVAKKRFVYINWWYHLKTAAFRKFRGISYAIKI